jgi:hypothetical protein
MLVRLLTCSLLLAVLGCLMVGCSDDTRRITSPSTMIQPEPLTTAFDGLNDQSGSLVDDGYVYDPWNMDADDESSSGLDDPMDRFDSDGDVSGKPIDKGVL